jgi:hypothetical protein
MVSVTQVPYSFPRKDDSEVHLQKPSCPHPLVDNNPENSMKKRMTLVTQKLYIVMNNEDINVLISCSKSLAAEFTPISICVITNLATTILLCMKKEANSVTDVLF